MSTSRLIVKNLPKHVDENRLRQHFSQISEVTDVKVMRTQDGQSRRFGFVGFRTEADASKAQKYFNKTFLDTSKLNVSSALGINDKALPRPWSKYSKGSSAFEKRNAPPPKAVEEEDNNNNNAKGTKKRKERGEVEGEDASAAAKGKAVVPQLVEEFVQGKGSDDVKDPKLKEFLSLMQPQSKNKAWANDDGIDVGHARVEMVPNKKPGGQGMMVKRMHVTFDDSASGSSDDEEFQDLPSTVANAQRSESEGQTAEQPTTTTTQSAKDFLKSKTVSNLDKDSSSDDDEEDNNKNKNKNKNDDDDDDDDDDDNGNKNDVDSDNHSQQSIDQAASDPQNDTNSKSNTTTNNNNNNNNNNEDESTNNPKQSKHAREQTPEEIERALTSGRLFIRNLLFSIDEEDLLPMFSRFGTVIEVHVPVDKNTQQGKGYAYVQFDKPENAIFARETLDGSILFGRLVHVLHAQPKKEIQPTNEKDARNVKKKNESMQERAWNSLFMRQDTVAAATAAKLGVAKFDLLDTEKDGSAAVRVALSEAALAQETKKLLEEQGVCIDALDPSQKDKRERSNKIILVKNLPFDVTEDDLQTMFMRFGTLVRLVLPPTKTIAIVEFVSTSEAKAAFRKLAFSNFKQTPLLLEWAPTSVFRANAPTISTQSSDGAGVVDEAQSTNKSDTAASKGDDQNAAGDEEDDDDNGKQPAMSSVFCKNLAFSTTEDTLKDVFQKKGFRVRSVRIPQKRVLGTTPQSQPKSKENATSSLGYGFVEFASVQELERALRQAQGIMVDGRALELQRSSTTTTNSKDKDIDKKFAATNKGSTKLLVRNIPFEASKSEVMELFSSVAEIKSVRLPRKFDGNHRGFAFVECLTKKEASKAMDILRTTHLYGRHLVIEFAKDDETVEQLRERVKEHFGGSSADARPAKRQKTVFAEDDEDDDFLPL